MQRLIQKYSDSFVSKWLVLVMDIFLVGVSFVFSTAFRFNFELTYVEQHIFKYHLLLVLLVRTATFIYLKSYTGVVRHTSLEDANLLTKASVLSTTELLLFSLLPLGQWTKYVQVPPSILFIDFFIGLVGLIASRLLIKTVFENLGNSLKFQKEVIIYGAGNLGIITKNTLLNDKKYKNHILCFIDDNPQKIGKSIEGIAVLEKSVALARYLEEHNNQIEVIFAIQSIDPDKKGALVDEFLEKGLKMKVVPPVKAWINGQLSMQQIQKVKIEDLLERPAIQINNRMVKPFLANKKILITGAAGSIGSEIVRQVLAFKPKELILVDQAESALYDLESELVRVSQDQNYPLHIEVVNICDAVQMEKLFGRYLPEVVFHAAAYKHVPLMERHPYKAIEVNVLGTQLIADLASQYQVEKFVMISTDKAVNPTNVMGATKRLAEMYVQSLNQHHANDTRFIVTRFGNVLGSNGSVIPLFKKQIAKGGPVTVTHPDIIRYFMTIPEACQLVLEAGTMGKGGEVYVFDMGMPVKIVDLAKRMIRLSGFEPFSQIPITFTGLRSGEKLFEELLGDEETTLATHHPKIMVAKVRYEAIENLKASLKEIKLQLASGSNPELVSKLKALVPEYISNNSPFESLDDLEQHLA
jgi:FlaA1/EpsC-like NDP-sugar epimerase